MITRDEILRYEVAASWWASWIPICHGLIGRYFAWKVTRKWNRYLVAVERLKYLKAKGYRFGLNSGDE